MIRAVIFDIDGVLLDSFGANFKFYNDLMERIGRPAIPKKDFFPLFPRTIWEVIEARTGLTEEKDIKPLWEIARKEIEFHYELLKAPHGMESAVQLLSKIYSLALVTGRLHQFVDKIPQLVPIMACFKSVVGYEDTENHKPHPEPLLVACERLKVQPAESVYVGDADTDIECARAAGTRIIVFNYPVVKKPQGADAYFSSFTELPNLIAAF